MSAKVGRVGYVYKGDYNNLTEYSRLNCVKYTDGNIYVAKGNTVGNLPTNSTYWDLFVQGVNNASDLAYDNTVSGLTADDVQEAIDELASGKQDTLTFDASPTEDSTNPVTSGGVYTALGNKQDTLTFDNSPTENSTNPVKSGGVYSAIEDVQDYAEDNISAIVNVYGSKNLNIYQYYETTKSGSGITFTDNGDGTITVSGTASADVDYVMHNYYSADKELRVSKGKYVLNGCPSGGSASTYFLQVYPTTSLTSFDEDYGDGTTAEFSSDTRVNLIIRVKSGTVISSPITFKPMIRDARISDPTYVPYVMTNRELTFTTIKTADCSFAFNSKICLCTIFVNNLNLLSTGGSFVTFYGLPSGVPTPKFTITFPAVTYPYIGSGTGQTNSAIGTLLTNGELTVWLDDNSATPVTQVTASFMYLI